MGLHSAWVVTLALLLGACSAGGGDSSAAVSDTVADTVADIAEPTADLAGDVSQEPFPGALAAALGAAAVDHTPEVGAPGLTVTVALPGHEIWQWASGLRSSPGDEPVRPNDRFRIGSITKTFNAAMVLQLVEAGEIGLDDPLDDHLAGWDLGPEVTIRRLLQHTTGIFDYTDDPTFLAAARTAVTPAEVVSFALANGPVFPPGEGWSYSNTNYFLLGMLLEELTGEPFAANLRTRLTGPLGLSETFLDGFEPEPVEKVDGHVNGNEATDAIDMSWAWASGGMVSTGADLCRWLGLLLEGRVLPAELTTAMLDVMPIPDSDDEAYGLAVRRVTRGGVVVHGHTGSTIGFRGEAFMDLASGVCVVVLTNDFLAVPAKLADPLWAAIGAHLAGD